MPREGWMERRDRAAMIALASALIIIAAAIFQGGVEWRLVAGLVITVPSLIMAGYYLVDRSAYDRAYSIGLFLIIAVVGAWIAGLGVRYVIVSIIVVIALVMIVTAIKK